MIYYNKELRRRLLTLKQSRPQDLVSIQEKLKSEDPLDRMEAVKELESIRTPAAVDMLMAYLLKNDGHLDMEDSVNPLAIQLLGWMADPRAIPALRIVEDDLMAVLSVSDDDDVFGFSDALKETLDLARTSIAVLAL